MIDDPDEGISSSQDRVECRPELLKQVAGWHIRARGVYRLKKLRQSLFSLRKLYTNNFYSWPRSLFGLREYNPGSHLLNA